MPTHNRRQFVARAIRCFERQTYDGPMELLVLDDGDPVGDLCVGPRIRYYRTPREVLGPKRQRAIDLARGDILFTWDDDDYHGPDRVVRQVAALAGGAGACLLRPVLFYRVADGRTRTFDGHADGTIAFTRAYADEVPFPNMDVGAGHAFIRAHRAPPIYIEGRLDYIAIRHGAHRTTCGMAGSKVWRDVDFDVTDLIRSA